MSTTQQEYKYNNNDKTIPDNVVLYLYTPYDSSSFDPFSLISCPIILVHPRRLYDGNDIEIAALVKLQILEAGRIF